jgi:hypothetical protein
MTAMPDTLLTDRFRTLAAAIEKRLVELYRPHAKTNYGKAAARFNDAAQAFTNAAHITDPEQAAADVITGDTEAREAWIAAEQFAAQLDAAVPILTVAAELAGAHIDNETGTLLTSCVDPTDQHRRELWEAWTAQDGRCGRWAALVALGARIRAAADLADITPHRQPQPIEYRTVPEPGAPRGFYQTVAHDPETPGYRPAEPEQVMIPGKMLTR